MAFLKAQSVRGLVTKNDWPRFTSEEGKILLLPDCIILMLALRVKYAIRWPVSGAFRKAIKNQSHETFALFLAAAARFGGRRHLNEPGYKLFWETMAIIASMLIFSALRPSGLRTLSQ